MIKIRTVGIQKVFLLIQTGVFIFLIMQVQLDKYENITLMSALILNCMGLFIVAFSVVKIPIDKKKRMTLFGIFCLSLFSITWIVLSVLIQFFVVSMP